MGGTQNSSLLFKDKPVFGLDVGFNTVKVMQVENSPGKKKRSIIGYGVVRFDSKAIKDGVIIDVESIAKSIKQLFKDGLEGHITTRRVVASVPAAHTFAKTMTLPSLSSKELDEAVLSELQQYIPMSLEELYVDYSVIGKNKGSVEILAVGAPKKIIDSHMDLLNVLGLEAVAFDTSTGAAGRLFDYQDLSTDIPAVLIDFGSLSADITIHDKTVIVTSTASCGGDIFTSLIAKKLGVTTGEGYVIKTKYGLGKSKKQKEITEALSPELEKLIKEIRRMVRYYEDRSNKNKEIGQIVIMGGGAHMPGLSDYLTNSLRLPVRMSDPWQAFNLGRLKAPKGAEKSMYVTSSGLSLVNAKEIFK